MRAPRSRLAGLLVRYLRPQWRRVAALAGVLLAGVAAQLAGPQIARSFLDTAVAGGSSQALTAAAALYLVAAAAGLLLTAAATYLAADLAWRATNRLRRDLADHCIRLDLAFHHARTPGEMIERIDGDAGTLSNFFSRFVLLTTGNVLLLAGVLLALTREGWWLGAAFGAYSLLALAALLVFRDTATPFWRRARQARAELFGFLEEHLAGLDDVRTSGAIQYVLRRFHQVARVEFRTSRTARMVSELIWAGNGVLFATGSVAALALGVALYQRGAASIGTVYLLLQYATALGRPLRTLAGQMNDLQQALGSVSRVQELLQTTPLIRDGPNTGRAPTQTPVPPSVAFDNVSFAYGDGPPALRGVSFRLSPGKVVGVLGRTGSGKSTLARLLFRFYDPTSGVIRLDGTDIRGLRLSDLRRRVGLVTQEVVLFRASVRNNLTFFDTKVSDAELCGRLGALGLDEWLRRLPRALDTMVGPGGTGLSAGEAQLLALGRVFLHDPGVVILDEASSRLDPATAQLLEGAIDRLLQHRTGIVIAHRLSTVARADDVLILDGGAISEYGPRSALAGDPSTQFAALLRAGLVPV